MRNGWFLFIVGLLGVFSAGSLLRVRTASGEPDAAAVPSVKPLVPMSADFDAGLAAKKRELEEAEQRLREREERLSVEEGRVKIQLDELIRLKGEIDAKRGELAARDSAEFDRLVKSLEGMQPKKASSIIASMEDGLAAAILRKMKEKKVSQVLDAMEPSRAVALSTILADRKPASTRKGKDQAPEGPARP